MNMSFYTIGAIGLVVLVFALYRQILGRKSKTRKYTSKKRQKNAAPIFIGFGLLMIGYAIYTGFKPEPDIVPEVFGYQINDVLGAFTPLALIVLNPFFSAGVFALSVGANDQFVLSKLSNQGTLAIPTNFSIQTLTRDDDGRQRWKFTYQFAEGFHGEIRFTGSEFWDWQPAIYAVTENNLGSEEIAHYFQLQYLSSSPGDHQLWLTKQFPQEMLAASHQAMLNKPEEMRMIETALANVEAGKLPVEDVVQEVMEQIAPTLGIKGKDGVRRSPFMSIVFWGFIALFVLAVGFALVMNFLN